MHDVVWTAVVAAALLLWAVLQSTVGMLMGDWMMIAHGGVLAGTGVGFAHLSHRAG